MEEDGTGEGSGARFRRRVDEIPLGLGVWVLFSQKSAGFLGESAGIAHA